MVSLCGENYSAAVTFAGEDAGINPAGQSSQIVGYNTVKYTAGKWLMAATPFENVGGGGINLQNLVTGFGTKDATFTTAAEAMLTCPYIEIQNRDAQGNVTGLLTGYFYVQNAIYTQSFSMTGGPHYENTYKEGWCNSKGHYVGGQVVGSTEQVVIAPGTAFWFKDPLADADICVAGQVVDKNAEELEPTVNKWNMICNPFPMPVALNSDKLVLEGATEATFTTAAEAASICPCIQIQNRDSNGNLTGLLSEYYYVKNAIYTQSFSMAGGPHYENTYKEGWCNSKGHYVGGQVTGSTEQIAVPAGAGIWFKDPASSCTVKWVK